MKTVTYEEFLKFKPCWLKYEDGAERIKAYFDRFGGSMSALDILNLNDVSKADKLWSVLREEFIPASMLHEFACVCAEYALSLIDNPDPRSIKAIEVKRAWIRDEATDEELAVARDAACVVAEDAYATYRAAYVDRDAPSAAVYASPDGSTSLYAPRDAIKVAPAFFAAAAAYEATCGDASAAKKAGEAAVQVYTWAARRSAAWDVLNATYEAQVAYLIMTLEEEK